MREYKNQPFGNYFAGDGLSNIPVGGKWGTEVAFQFVATETVPVNRLRFFNAWSNENPGYHSGTGGKLLISLRSAPFQPGYLQTDALINQPAHMPKQLLVEFNETAILKRGQTYRILFENVDEAAAVNWVSVNTLRLFSIVTPQVEHGLKVLARVPSMEWQERPGMLPIFSLFYLVGPFWHDQIAVPGYGEMESWIASPGRIAGPEMVRQVFKPFRDVSVSSVVVRVAKNGNPGPLVARLCEGLVQIGEGNAAAEKVRPIDLQTMPPNRLGHDWVTIPFAKRLKLTAGMEYRLSLQTTPGDAYEVFPLRDGAEFGYCPVWTQAWAEFTTEGARGWQAWKPWGKSSLEGDLQLFFNA